jgi:hypothetical protein
MNQSVKKARRAGAKKKKAPQAEPTRTEQILDHIAASALPEDALVTLCSTMPAFAAKQLAGSTCRGTIKEKENLIAVKVREILSELIGAFWIISRFGDEIEAIPDIYNYLRSVQKDRFGDRAIRSFMDRVVAYAKENKKWTVAKATKDKKPKGKGEEKRLQYAMRMDSANEPHGLLPKYRTEDLKLRADSLISWTIALTDLLRQRRFFIGMDRCLSGAELECSFCRNRFQDYSTMLFMGRCGHAGCQQCYENTALDKCIDPKCGSKTLPSSTVRASDLTAASSSQLTREHGTKMVAITDVLVRVPEGEKVLIFVQFPRITTALKAILLARDIRFADTTDSRKAAAAANVDKFKRCDQDCISKKCVHDPHCNVCILQLDSVDAAGW